MEKLRALIEEAWESRALLQEAAHAQAVLQAVELLDRGELRVMDPATWQVNQWVKKAVVLFFPLSKMQVMEVGSFEFFDKIPLKKNLEKAGVRVVPHGIARYGSFLEAGAVMMPSYVNIGAYVGSGTMVDTWATVGSCAQIGKNVHLSGGVGIGGVLEPVTAEPVVVEDDCFIGSRCILVEGVHIGREAVLGANVCLTKSTHIIDVSGQKPRTYKGMVPPRSVVIPGSMPKEFPAGTYHVPCALIIGQRKASTDTKTTLNDALRDFNISC
ncbi:MAG: 2,3,4,5-tetrahydropyridine-2,6-dicarboxylate N-succinyltransferase [Bacteroides sp.]|nr:2,3,4,5-tetrahydropyridine-2,6-dicarboxylate N-succinyltransferase [Ruminococcus flavefaciens]MCM1554352.1 2,3,4,5-tetrahydropyridine-2,6-dicarboxylate N-succinyltransferase [Bacteroides sp.]